jgi:hypothetical protein
MHYFRSAAENVDRDPDRSLEEIRKVLEGWSHLVCVVLDPEFRPYDGKELRREQLATVLRRAREHLPSHRRDALAVLKGLGDSAHHNQGHIQRASPRVARGGLLQCADILEWLFTDVLREPVPNVITEVGHPSALSADDLGSDAKASRAESGSRKRPTWQGGIIIGAVATLIFMIIDRSESRSPSGLHGSGEPSAEAGAPADPLGPTSSAVGHQPKTGASSHTLARVRAYEAAIATRDVDRILSLHRFPAARWFATSDVPLESVRKNYLLWFERNDRRVSFHDCKVEQEGAVRCDVDLEPPLEKHPERVPTCLVFDSAGLLISRTELKQVPECPPPGVTSGEPPAP